MTDFKLPITLDSSVWLSSPQPRQEIATIGDLSCDCFFLTGEKGTRTEVSGYDSSHPKARVTNLSGIKGGALLKRCPGCGLRKPMLRFGVRGREMNGRRRDQSNCNACRGLE